jgi:hypothetical protein
MKISGRYSPGLHAGVMGFLLLVGINAFTIPNSLSTAKERDRIAAEAELETTKAEAAKKVADAYAKNKITKFKQLIVKDYTLSNTPPKMDWRHSVDPTQKTVIYDKYRRCTGYAYQGKFYFTLYYTGVCNG